MTKKDNIVLFILFTCYAIIGLNFSNSQGFWHDEIYTLTFLKGISAYTFSGNSLSTFTEAIPIQYCKNILHQDNFLNNFNIQILHEGHPPLYFLFLKFWSSIFGYTEISLRSFSLLSGILSMLVLFKTLVKFLTNKKVSWIILLLLLINPYLFYYFTEARMYAFAFLFAVLSFRYWLNYKKHKKLKSLDFCYFSIASVALLYTHYYGMFFFLSLFIFDIFKNGISRKSLSYIIPILIFSPWIFIIKIQTEFHNIHWTDGSYSLLDSSLGFCNGLISLFFSPMTESSIYETLFAILISLLLICYMSKTWKSRLIYISIVFFYFLQIFIFDKLLNHHTIVVSRYYIFILLFFYWAIAKAIEKMDKKILIPFLFTFIFLSGLGFYKIYSLELAPKQMFRELANYIDQKHNSQNTLIVVEPGGPIIWSLSYYLKNDFEIISADNFTPAKNSKNVIYVDEMLGDKYWENKLNSENQKNLNFVPFVGVFLYE